MDINTRERQQIILFTLITLIIPMLIFPRQFGTELARGSVINLLYEMVYYSIVIYLFQRRGGLIQLVKAAGVCLLYRMVVSLVFSILISAMYVMNLKISITLGVFSYLPSILFQIAVTPFILQTITSNFYTPEKLLVKPINSSEPKKVFDSGNSLVASKSKVKRPTYQKAATTPVVDLSIPSVKTEVSSTPNLILEAEGFDRVVKYIGEHAAVKMAAVVDEEGLPLSSFGRGDIDTDSWTPMARLLLENNRISLGKFQTGYPEKLDIHLENNRVAIVHCEFLDLIVISEIQMDDVLNIRINQGVEMIKKVVAKRYKKVLGSELEKTDVRSS